MRRLLLAAGTLTCATLTCAAPALSQNRIDLMRPDAPQLALPGDHPVGVRAARRYRPLGDGVPALHDGADEGRMAGIDA